MPALVIEGRSHVSGWVEQKMGVGVEEVEDSSDVLPLRLGCHPYRYCTSNQQSADPIVFVGPVELLQTTIPDVNARGDAA